MASHPSFPNRRDVSFLLTLAVLRHVGDRMRTTRRWSGRCDAYGDFGWGKGRNSRQSRPGAPERFGAFWSDLIVYRPGFSGHKILLCGRPDWGACGEPFAPGLSRAAVGILLQQPGLVIARDEGPDRNANLLGSAEDPAPHDLLLEGADKPLRHTVGLGLADEGKARRHAEEGILVLEGVGHKAAAVVVGEQRPARGVAPPRPAG